MSYERVWLEIKRRREELKLSERKLCMRAEVGEKSVYSMKLGHAPKPGTLAKLERVLGFPANYLAALASDGGEAKKGAPGKISLATVFVKGEVQGGIFRDALEWPADQWFPVTVPVTERFLGVDRFGLVVRGSSMDRIYPEGTIVIVVRFEDIDRSLQVGDRVVVLHRSQTGEGFEATLKEYGVDNKGRHVLWPRSTDPDFQSPYVLTTRDGLPADDSRPGMPTVAVAGRIDDESGEPDLRIAGLVVGSYRQEDI